MREQDFEAAFDTLVQQFEASGFEQDQHHLAKTALSDKYGTHLYQNYKHIRELRDAHVPLDRHEEAYRIYKRQLDLYAGEAELVYKPFTLLKEVLETGEELLPDGKTSELYRFLSDDECLPLDLQNPEAYGRAEQFFSRLTAENGMEGVVIKPEQERPGVVPYMKVRNPGYLSIIYGYDYFFPHKYRKLMKQKSIVSKLRTSMNEYRLGKQMLAIKLGDITPDNENYKQIAANLLFEVAKEKEIDPRL